MQIHRDSKFRLYKQQRSKPHVFKFQLPVKLLHFSTNLTSSYFQKFICTFLRPFFFHFLLLSKFLPISQKSPPFLLPCLSYLFVTHIKNLCPRTFEISSSFLCVNLQISQMVLQLFFTLAFSAVPLTLYVPPVRSLNLFLEAVEGFLRESRIYTNRVYPRVRVVWSRLVDCMLCSNMRQIQKDQILVLIVFFFSFFSSNLVLDLFFSF